MTDFVGYNEWAARTLGVAIATDFVYEQEPNGDRGVFIAEDVAPHTEVFSVPLDSLLTVRALHAAEAPHPLAQLAFFRHCDADCEDDQLALALLYETHVARAASRWSEHLARLPRRYSNVLFFRGRALRRLRGSNLFFIAQQMQRKVADDYAALRARAIEPLVAALLRDGGGGCGLSRAELDTGFSLERYKWALSTVWSRFVSLRVAADGSVSDADEPSGSPSDFFGMARVKAMVPVFDMLNHDPEAEMAHFLDLASQRFKLVSHQHWAAGSQMFINYGALSNHKLLALYGFVLEHNPFDALDVWLPMDPATASRFADKAALLAANGLEHATAPFELAADELNELLLIAVRIQEIECGSSEELRALAAKALDGEVLSVANEHATLTRLIYTLQKMLEEFGDDDDNDDDNGDDNGDNGDSEDESERTRHERMAAVVRRSDQTILAETIEMLKWELLQILPTP
ncbi:hypothetical protein PybrP1_003280 [[Pythium] brassicae (nom. inval.)]|nr:hypothetical protein PybrP1_003280 [[Pythium] brassicae (nom. inval.)]